LPVFGRGETGNLRKWYNRFGCLAVDLGLGGEGAPFRPFYFLIGVKQAHMAAMHAMIAMMVITCFLLSLLAGA